jgi:hypothetical protein
MFAGILIDKIGMRAGMIIYTLMMVAAMLLYYISALNGNYLLLAIGTTLFGLGSEAMCIIQSKQNNTTFLLLKKKSLILSFLN